MVRPGRRSSADSHSAPCRTSRRDPNQPSTRDAQPAANAPYPHAMWGGEYANVTRCVPAPILTPWNTPFIRRGGVACPSTAALQPERSVSRRTSSARLGHESRTDSLLSALIVHAGLDDVKYGAAPARR